MIKQLTAIAAGALCIGVTSASAQNVKSAMEKDWGHFQTLMQKCDPLAGAEAAKCMEDAKAVFLASDFKCESFIDQDKESCLQLSQVWRKTPAAAEIMRDENESAAGQSGAAPEDNSAGAPRPSSDPSSQRPRQ
jgi:hypothetical protein